MKRSDPQSSKIANLGLLCSVSVVLGHIRWLTVDVSGNWARFGLVAHSLSRAALLFFFVVSGYFLAQHLDEPHWWRHAVVKRLKTLLVPFFAWSVIYLAEMACVDVALNLFAGRGAFSNLRGMWGNARQFFGCDPFVAPALVPLWYLRNLFLLVLVSPIVVWFGRRFRTAWILFLAAVHFVTALFLSLGVLEFTSGIGAVLTTCFTTEGLLYFSIGCSLSSGGWTFCRGSWRGRVTALAWILGVGMVVAIAFPFTARYGLVLEVCAMPLLAWAAWESVPSSKWPRWIVSAAFPMYLVHPIVFDMIYEVCRWKGWNVRSISFCWILFAVTLVGSVVLANGVRKCGRFASKVLFGGR